VVGLVVVEGWVGVVTGVVFSVVLVVVGVVPPIEQSTLYGQSQ